VNLENYEPCGARLAQGDIVRAPVGAFVAIGDLQDPSLLGAEGPPLNLGDPQGIAVSLPRLCLGPAEVVLRAWYLPAVVVSPDCAVDKRPTQLLVAPIAPLAAYPRAEQDGIRAGTFVAAFDLPAEPSLRLADGTIFSFPQAVVDLGRTVPVSPTLIEDQRMFSLGASHIDRLQETLVRYVALREISSTGTIAACVGKRVAQASTVESSKRRHTVVLTFEDDSSLVLYQEPRRAGDHLQSVAVRGGAFSPASIRAFIATNLVLRFENDDNRDWDISCPEVGVEARRVAAASTTEILVHCPEEPCDLMIVNTAKRNAALRVQVVAPPEQGR
jgi:hypothetical protein